MENGFSYPFRGALHWLPVEKCIHFESLCQVHHAINKLNSMTNLIFNLFLLLTTHWKIIDIDLPGETNLQGMWLSSKHAWIWGKWYNFYGVSIWSCNALQHSSLDLLSCCATASIINELCYALLCQKCLNKVGYKNKKKKSNVVAELSVCSPTSFGITFHVFLNRFNGIFLENK